MSESLTPYSCVCGGNRADCGCRLDPAAPVSHVWISSDDFGDEDRLLLVYHIRRRGSDLLASPKEFPSRREAEIFAAQQGWTICFPGLPN